ncbi:hypothetical protein HMPREF0185_01748 [Brevundimonas diminuta 470-4]|nr:hypothetical protein HMPREF0185_01748 [Brevundimonas diminuta 470-4]
MLVPAALKLLHIIRNNRPIAEQPSRCLAARLIPSRSGRFAAEV